MQLQRHLEQFDAAGVSVFAISYDPQEAQADFAREFGISFPLLADPDHEVIEATGILNTLVEPSHGIYGIPFPGSYVIDQDGTVAEKLFFRSYRSRPSAATVLRDGIGIDFEVANHPRADASGDGVSISATLGSLEMVFAEVASLYVDLEVDHGLHLYGQPIPEGFIATEVTVSAPDRIHVGSPRYPETVPFRVEGLDVDFRIFPEGQARISVSINNGLTEGDSFPLTVTVRYQTCSDRECFIPQERTLELVVPVAGLLRP